MIVQAATLKPVHSDRYKNNDFYYLPYVLKNMSADSFAQFIKDKYSMYVDLYDITNELVRALGLHLPKVDSLEYVNENEITFRVGFGCGFANNRGLCRYGIPLEDFKMQDAVYEKYE